MKIKNKGKVHPSPSSSSSSIASSNGDRDVLYVLKLLPAAILTLASILSLEDREVLAYMITRSMKTATTTTNPSSLVQDSNKKKSSKKPTPNTTTNNHKKAPVFDCDCFDCYTSYWFRWDSSPNRELIHQAIEAFEDHLTNGENSRKNTRGGKRRDRTGRRVCDKQVIDDPGQPERPVLETLPVQEIVFPDDDISPAASPEVAADGGGEEEAAEVSEGVPEMVPEATEEKAVVVRTHAMVVSDHKGLARKVLPDVLGLLNSRLWSLWSPNV